MRSRARLLSAATAAGLALCAAWPASADADFDRFKAEIDAFVARIGPDTNGTVRWVGADPYDIRRDADNLIAVVSNAQLALQLPDAAQITLDRIEIRRRDAAAGGKLTDLDIRLPGEIVADGGSGGPVKVTMKEAAAKATVEAATGRIRDAAIAIEGGRVEQPSSGTWIQFGALRLTSKLVEEAGGGWSGPLDFEVTGIEFFSAQEQGCLLYTSPSPRDLSTSRMPSSA